MPWPDGGLGRLPPTMHANPRAHLARTSDPDTRGPRPLPSGITCDRGRDLPGRHRPPPSPTTRRQGSDLPARPAPWRSRSTPRATADRRARSDAAPPFAAPPSTRRPSAAAPPRHRHRITAPPHHRATATPLAPPRQRLRYFATARPPPRPRTRANATADRRAPRTIGAPRPTERHRPRRARPRADHRARTPGPRHGPGVRQLESRIPPEPRRVPTRPRRRVRQHR